MGEEAGGRGVRDSQVCEAQFTSSPSVFSVHVVCLSLSTSIAFSPHFSSFFSPHSLFFWLFFSTRCWSVALLFSVVSVFVVRLLGYPVGHDAVVKAVFPPP